MTTPAKFIALMAWMACLACLGQQAIPPAEFPAPEAIREAVLRANDYFLSHDTLQTNGWARGAYYTGNMRAFQVLGVDRYLRSAIDWSTRNAWLPGIKGATNADG